MESGRSNSSDSTSRVFADDGRRQEIDEVRRDADGAVAGTAAAVRNAKGLMRIEMHEIEAHVARTRVAHQGVGVRSVVIHEAARGVHGIGDLLDVIFEEAEGVGIGHHADGRIVAEHRFERFDADASALVALERDDLVSDHRGGRRIRTVRRIGDDDGRALRAFASLVEVGFGDEQRREFRVRARCGIERKRGHAEDRAEVALEIVHRAERALREFVRGEGMQIAEARQIRHRIVDARVVLHRARARADRSPCRSRNCVARDA